MAVFLLLGISDTVKAKSIDSYEDYKIYCSPQAYHYNLESSECTNYKNIYEQELREELNQQQELNYDERNNRRQNVRQANKIKGYAGISLGAFFPDDLDDFFTGLEDFLGVEDPNLDLDTGFGGTIFLGAKFNKNFGADIEFSLLGGGTEIENLEFNLLEGGTVTEDVNYSVWGLFINPRFILPLADRDNSVSIFISPGIGISKAKLNLDIPDELAEENGVEEGLSISLEDDISFTWQIKLGLSLPINNKYNGFAQVRYVNPTGENTVDFFSTEAGLAINF
ncbi:MAG: outer membrane beta-barrel protein [Xenococcaceae cyanobacterium MO_188.B32]|nr:outer membrane beta-barrel protein [Xenococcaceae cyanobacterium MO_188.B32]